MLPFNKMSRRQTVLVSMVSLIILILIGYFTLPYLQGRFDYPFVQREQAETVKAPGTVKITERTVISKKVKYTKCNDEQVIRQQVDASLVGLTLQQLQKAYPEWNIASFGENELEMVQQVDGYCREHSDLFIGVNDEKVAVYLGKPGERAILKETTPVRLSELMPQDVEELRRGLVVKSNEELLRTLEGMQSR